MFFKNINCWCSDIQIDLWHTPKKEQKIVKAGDILINTGSMPIEKRYRTNMMKVTIVE